MSDRVSSETLVGTTASERTETILEAFRILGHTPDADEIRAARTGLWRALADGYSLEEALIVARWARWMYDSGEDRFEPNLNPAYLWSTGGRFSAYLNAAYSGPRHCGANAETVDSARYVLHVILGGQ